MQYRDGYARARSMRGAFALFAAAFVATGVAAEPVEGGDPALDEPAVDEVVAEDGASEETAQQGPDTAYDPFAGIEQSGRIPAVERPADMERPERWRYIPEGRLKPGNVLERFLVSSFIAPFVTQDEDTGTGFGVAITDIDFRTQRRQEFAGIFLSYSTEGEQDYTIVWQRWLHHREREGGGVFQEERSRIRVSGGYEKTLTKRFFGFGPNTPEDWETSYIDEKFELDIGMDVSWPDPGGDLVLGGGIRMELHELYGGRESDVPQMGCHPSTLDDLFLQNCHREEFFASRHADLGFLYWDIRYDTRDSQANAYEGWMIGASMDAALLQNGGDIGARYTIRAKKIFEVPGLFHSGAEGDEEHPPTDTLAFGFRTQLSSGDLPFFKRPMLGGRDLMRGYIDGRWRDKASWWLGAEWRLWVLPRGFPIPFTRALRVERVGIAPFYEVGAVGPSGFDLFDSKIRHSYGVGLRVTLERQAPFRVDFGFSGEGSTLIARFGLPF